ncbi:hypothetical protein M0R45_035936 [Rubus argutus]|uniref:Uncharacterized protein n=1 Tax=Rubus argutus TaxID=59490 RepID=A0AAW1VVN0_RUBAR
MRPNSERNGSKSGRPPLKKLSDRKAFASLGHLSSNGSPDCAGESDDDREELTAAANFACNARNFACSSPFWKKMEPIFGFSLQEAFYLKEQLISMEENDGYLSRIFGNGTNDLGDVVHKENVVSKTLVSGPKERNVQDQIQEVGILRGRVDSEGRKTVPPLYQRVLSALIMEDDTEEFEKDINDIDGRTLSIQYNGNNSPFDTCSFNNVESKNRVEIQFAEETSPHTVNRCSVDRFSCNGASGFDIGIYPGFSKNGVDASLHVCTNSSGISSFVHSYEKMPLEDKLLLELQSVGLYQETVPDLEDGEDGAIDQQIDGLQKLLHEQVDTKKMQLKKFIKSIEEGMELEKRHREQVAMDRLVELAYRKLLATRGSMASKFGISRVPRQIANAFMKRTLARCHKFDETGKSCFNDPALQDAIFATPPYGNNGEPTKCYGLSLPPENQKCKQEPGGISKSLSLLTGTSSLAQRDHHNNFGRSGSFESLTHPSEQEHSKTGPMLYRGKKKEVLLDDVGGLLFLESCLKSWSYFVGSSKRKKK